jgi:hypothetical protein
LANFDIQRATVQDAINVALNLREEDRSEIIHGHGHSPMVSLLLGVKATHSITAFAPDGKPACMAGVDEYGGIWMLCTPEIHQAPRSFVRQAKRWVDSLPYRYLYNRADIRNTVHLKLLKHFGFKFLRVVPHGPNNLYFVEFIKLCAVSPQQ